MIDLRKSGLPCRVRSTEDGELHEVVTDWRTWLAYSTALEKGEPFDRSALFADGEWHEGCAEGLGEFAASKNSCPHGMKDGERVMDFLEDGELIVAAFQQAYGIDLTQDLTQGEMHWHRFLALLRNLPEGTKLSDVIGYRAYRKDSRKHDAVMRELKKEWSLPPRHDARLEDWANAAFGKIKVGEK